MQRHSGFTLLELSVVILVLGLVAASVVLGADLIRLSRVRADIAALEGFDRAIANFSLKYSCLPGDCANASRMFPPVHNGNGNGIIEGAIVAGQPRGISTGGEFSGYELAHAISHLAHAGLIDVATFDSNAAAIVDRQLPSLSENARFVLRAECVMNGNVCIRTGKHTYRLGVSASATPGLVQTLPTLYKPADAQNFDEKIDDGRAMTGRVTVGVSANANSNPFLPASSFLTGGLCNATSGRGLNISTCEYDHADTSESVGLFVRTAAY